MDHDNALLMWYITQLGDNSVKSAECLNHYLLMLNIKLLNDQILCVSNCCKSIEFFPINFVVHVFLNFFLFWSKAQSKHFVKIYRN